MTDFGPDPIPPPVSQPIPPPPATSRVAAWAVLFLVGVSTVTLAALGALTYAVVDLTDILNRRSPVIARIDDAEDAAACRDALQARFSEALGRLVLGATTPREERDPEALTLAAAEANRYGELLGAVADGSDPCAVLPD